MRKILLVCAVAMLAACDATPEQQEADLAMANDNVPEGCTLSFVGNVRVAGNEANDPSSVFIAQCKATDVTTVSATREVQEGKTTRPQNDVTIVVEE